MERNRIVYITYLYLNIYIYIHIPLSEYMYISEYIHMYQNYFSVHLKLTQYCKSTIYFSKKI